MKRCDHCKWWARDDGTVYFEDNWSLCQRHTAKGALIKSSEGDSVWTHASFSCVQWEPIVEIKEQGA